MPYPCGSMFLKQYHIEPSSVIADIVAMDYRTAGVFRRYEIEYMQNSRKPLSMACQLRGLDTEKIINELEEVSRPAPVPGLLPFRQWNIDFLADYIVHVHHYYLRQQLPDIKMMLRELTAGHLAEDPSLQEVEKLFLRLYRDLFPHLKHEEEIIFPYIRQIAHAFESKESYASLLVKTLRKPLEEVMNAEHASAVRIIHKIRNLTADYSFAPHADVGYRVTYSKLRELDHDLMQHIHLENNILFPRAIEMEQVLLNRAT